MKKIIICLSLMFLLTGCADMENSMKHTQSSFVGLIRIVTLYSANGNVIKEWHTKSKIEYEGSVAWFLYGGKAIAISGTFTVEEQ